MLWNLHYIKNDSKYTSPRIAITVPNIYSTRLLCQVSHPIFSWNDFVPQSSTKFKFARHRSTLFLHLFALAWQILTRIGASPRVSISSIEGCGVLFDVKRFCHEKRQKTEKGEKNFVGNTVTYEPPSSTVRLRTLAFDCFDVHIARGCAHEMEPAFTLAIWTPHVSTRVAQRHTLDSPPPRLPQACPRISHVLIRSLVQILTLLYASILCVLSSTFSSILFPFLRLCFLHFSHPTFSLIHWNVTFFVHDS